MGARAMTMPPLPPGFVLDSPHARNRTAATAAQPPVAPVGSQPAGGDLPPLPPGFVLETPEQSFSPNSGMTREQRQADLAAMPAPEDELSFLDRALLAAEPLAREFALGGRAMLEGLGATVGIVTDPVAYGASKLWNGIDPPEQTMSGLIAGEEPQERRIGSAREGFSALADALGAPHPETASERIGSDITGALTGTALTLGLGGALNAGRSTAATIASQEALVNPAASARSLVEQVAESPSLRARLGDILSSQPGLQIASATAGSGASGLVREEGGEAGAQLAAGVLGALSPAGATYGVPASIRRVMRGGEANRRALGDAIEDFSALGGATPTVGQGTGSRLRQGAETLLGAGPTSSGVMARAGEAQGESLAKGLDDFARRLSDDPTAAGAGASIESGVGAYTNRVRGVRSALYDRVDQFVPPETPVPLTRTQAVLAKLTTPTLGAEATTSGMINPILKQRADDLAADIAAAQAAGRDGLPYEAVKELRTKIGKEAFPGFSLTTDKPTAELREVWSALKSDMDELARQAGPEAERAVKRANKFYQDSQKRLDLLERVVKKNGGSEKVFQAAMSGTREGATVLRQVMDSLPKDAQRDVTAAVIKRMGLATPGAQGMAGEAFSASTFLTNWNRLSPEARRELFNRFGPEMSGNINRIARVAERIKEGSGVLQNPSGTAQQAAAFGYGGGLTFALLNGDLLSASKLAAGGGIANLLARSLTNPRIVQWLARNTDRPVGELPAQINVLKRIADNTGDPEVAELAEALSQPAEDVPEVNEK